MKRAFDFIVSLVGLVLLSPIFVIIALLIKLDSVGSVFFAQRRIGQSFRPFLIYKFRTMTQDAEKKGGLITVGEDPRITRVGWLLRESKFDELPQLINVLKGEMSLVGPRPEVPPYVELYRKDYEDILKIRPGITDLASIHYRDESAMLGQFKSPEQEYVMNVLPEKIRLAKEYIRQSSLLFDLRLIIRTLWRLLEFKRRSEGTSR